MGWLWLIMIAGLAFLALWRFGAGRELAWLTGAALAIGAAGYAWQQRAFLPGHPVKANVAAVEIDPGLVAFRSAIMPGNEAVLAAADDRLRAGDPSAASQIILNEIAKRPNDAALWAGLGSAITTHDGGQVSPAALFAFQKAVLLAPNSPGPPFMLGLAEIQGGQMAEAKVAWIRALSLAPGDAPYRVDIAERLVMIDQFIAMQAAEAAQHSPPTGG